MTTRDTLRVEQVYFENLKRTMNELAAKKSELDGTMQTIAENAVAADENIIMLYKNLCEAWIEAENLFKKVDTDTQAITERIDSLEKEFNEKIDEVNNYIVSITRALDERLTQAEEDIDALEGRMTTAESDIDALEGRMDTAEGDIDALEGRMDTAEGDINSLKTEVSEKADLIYDTISDQSTASISDGQNNGKIKSLVVSIQPVQSGSGDPSPSNIRPITGWEGCTISRSGADTSDPTTFSISWQSATGTVYGGKLDVANGVLTVDYGLADLGELYWSYQSSNERFYSNSIMNLIKGGTENAISSIYVLGNTVTTNYTIQVATNGYFYVKDTRYNDAPSFKTAMSGVQLVYELDTPITYQLTPIEVNTLIGVNNVWTDTGDIISMEYPCDTKLYIDKKISQITPTNVSATRTEHDFSAAQEVFDALQKTEITDAEEPEEER